MANKNKKPKNEVVVTEGKGRKLLIINGEKYVLDREKYKVVEGIEHSDGKVFKRFDEKQYLSDLKTVVKAISKRTTKQELLVQILKDIDMKSLKRLARRIKAKKPIKKQHGCLGFKIGDAYLQVVD